MPGAAKEPDPGALDFGLPTALANPEASPRPPIATGDSQITCPYHSDRQWRELRERSPKEWADAVAFDRAIRHGHPAAIHKQALRGNAFLHPSLRPLDTGRPLPE